MSKPEDIPQDVWEKAEARFDQFLLMDQETFRPAVQIIARAILAAEAEERKACAAVAVGHDQPGYSEFVEGYNIACAQIAAAIRFRNVSAAHTFKNREE